MPTISLQSSYKLSPLKPLSVSEYKRRYLSGLSLPLSLTNEIVEYYIQTSLDSIESLLQIRYSKDLIEENRDFYRVDWVNWGHVNTTYLVSCPLLLEGFLNTTKQITYPPSWLSVKKSSDPKIQNRAIRLVPTRNSAHSEAVIFSGVIPQLHFMSSSYIPNYWKCTYLTGWVKPPPELIHLLGLVTSIQILSIVSDGIMNGNLITSVDSQGRQTLTSTGSTLVGGFGAGVSSKSISIDGLSQSFSSYVNGQTGIYGARLKQYLDEIDLSNPNSLYSRVNGTYGSITMAVL